MGMAASQARYLALTARKSNVEYEGQQINQARTSLANQTANYFNQMLGLKVPTPPDKTNFTTVQYSFSDGVNTEVLSNYYQLGNKDSDYNYVVTTYHNEKVFTGQRKRMSDPQIQYTTADHWSYDPSSSDNVRPKIVDKAFKNNDGTYSIQTSDGMTHIFRQVQPDDKDEQQVRAINLGMIMSGVIKADTNSKANLDLYDAITLDVSTDDTGTSTTKADSDEALASFGSIASTDTAKIAQIREIFEIPDGTEINVDDYVYSATAGNGGPAYALKSAITDAKAESAKDQADRDATKSKPKIRALTERYNYHKVDPKNEDDVNAIIKLYGITDEDEIKKIKNGQTVYYTDGNFRFVTGDDYTNKEATATITQGQGTNGAFYSDGRGNFSTYSELEDAVTLYNHNVATGDHDPINISMMTPTNKPTFSNYTHVGNCRLSELSTEDVNDPDTKAEIEQIIKDMKSADGSQLSASNLMECFDTDPNTGELIYKGGLYSFTMGGHKYYTTRADLDASAGTSIVDNDIDVQQNKLVYYNAVYLNTRVEDTQKALLETDGAGRFKTMKFEDDSVTYTLNAEQVTDEDAYDDAMNRYYYEKAEYEKQVADINAKTEVIQAQDRTLELRMEQLGTEQSALQNEMDAVKKVVDKHVELGFKTFGG